mmetsp:Transcript_26329/g.43124  ORF Transcript_26329/g.43124 Transcript_26329/m.43124 type:complete len:115 (-) Transcript_26329:1883-2227(-)
MWSPHTLEDLAGLYSALCSCLAGIKTNRTVPPESSVALELVEGPARRYSAYAALESEFGYAKFFYHVLLLSFCFCRLTKAKAKDKILFLNFWKSICFSNIILEGWRDSSEQVGG